MAVAGANAHDQTLVTATLDSIPIRRPRATRRRKQHLCADKGYDANSVRQAALKRRYQPHISRKGATQSSRTRRRGKARRWVVERTHSWTNRARGLLIRWHKKAANYLGFLHLQFTLTILGAAGVLG